MEEGEPCPIPSSAWMKPICRGGVFPGGGEYPPGSRGGGGVPRAEARGAVYSERMGGGEARWSLLINRKGGPVQDCLFSLPCRAMHVRHCHVPSLQRVTPALSTKRLWVPGSKVPRSNGPADRSMRGTERTPAIAQISFFGVYPLDLHSFLYALLGPPGARKETHMARHIRGPTGGWHDGTTVHQTCPAVGQS